MRVAILVRILMVNTMSRRPEDRAALKRHRGADRKEVLEHSRGFIRPVGVEAVISHPDSPADADPVQENCNRNRLPSGVKESRHGKNVEDHHRDHRDPVDLGLVAEIDVADAQSLLLVNSVLANSLPVNIGAMQRRSVIVM